ncbi:amidohydrolase [Acidothermaceae bacterium B102]|nr:amidohydrolase [Acidothermaceae bacterium B102]
MTADLLLVGTATPVAVVGGVIAAVGQQARDLRGARTQVVDLRGGTVTAGLVDSHTHPILGIDAMTGLDLGWCTSLDEIRAALIAAPPGDWITGWGVDPNVFGAREIHWREIDVIDRPVVLTLFDGHAALANPEALRRAGVTGARAFASQARVVVDEQGLPTGHLLEESAIGLVKSIVPREDFVLRKLRLGVLLAEMAATGLTGGHVMDLDGDGLDLVAALEDDDALPLRLRFAPWVRPEDDAARTADLLALQGRAGRTWEVAGVKLFIDGTVDAGTAWLHHPDCFGESTRAYWTDPADYTRAVQTYAAAGVQTATHAIGDAAVEHVLDTLAALDSGLRHRVEHIETLPLEQIARFAPAGVVASMQPTHATDYTRADHSDNWSRRLGEQRALRAWPCRDLVEAGVVLALGSDWPVAPYDPRLTLAAAQLRRPARRPELAPVVASQGLTAAQALYGMTVAPAFAARAEDRLGRVAPGYRADLTVWAADPVAVPGTEIADVPISLTVVDGRVVHRAPELS